MSSKIVCDIKNQFWGTLTDFGWMDTFYNFNAQFLAQITLLHIKTTSIKKKKHIPYLKNI